MIKPPLTIPGMPRRPKIGLKSTKPVIRITISSIKKSCSQSIMQALLRRLHQGE